MTSFVRSWICAAVLVGTVLAACPAAADPVTDAQSAWQAQVVANGNDSLEAVTAEWDLALALTNAGDLDAAHGHWLHMLAVAEADYPDDARLLAMVRIQLSMNLVRRGDYQAGADLAEAALPIIIETLGADSELVQLGHASQATAYILLGDYVRAEAPARAAYEAAQARDGGGRAGPYAMLLQQVLNALGRDTEGQAVLAQTDASDGAYSSRQQALTAYRESEDWGRLAETARRFAADWRAQGEAGDSLAMELAQEAEIDLALALLETARAGGKADFDEAITAIERVGRERSAGRQGWSLSRALNVESDIYLFWPGREDADRALALKGRSLMVLEADIGQDHPDALRQRLAYGVLLLQGDPAQAAPVLGGYYQAALDGLVPPEDWAIAASLLSTILAEGGQPESGYQLAAAAAAGLRDYVLAPSRSEDTRRILRRNDELFRTQVALAWGLAETL